MVGIRNYMCAAYNIMNITQTIMETALDLSLQNVIMSALESQITSLMVVCSTVYSGTDERKHQSSASLAFVRGIHRWPVNSPHKGPVTRKIFPFDDVIVMFSKWILCKSRGRKFANYHWTNPEELVNMFYIYIYIYPIIIANIDSTQPSTATPCTFCGK